MDMVPGMHRHIQNRQASSCGRHGTEKRGVYCALPVQPGAGRVSLFRSGRKMDSVWNPAALVYCTVYVPLVFHHLWRNRKKTAGVQ